MPAGKRSRLGIVLIAVATLGAPQVSASILTSYDYAGIEPGKSRFGEQPFLDPGGGNSANYQWITLDTPLQAAETAIGLELSVEVGRQGNNAVPLTVNIYEGHLGVGADLTANIVATGNVGDIPQIASGSTPPGSWTAVSLTGALPARADGQYTFAVVTSPTDGHVRMFGGFGQQFGGEVDRYDGGGSDGGWGKSWNGAGGGSYPLTDGLFGSTPQWASANFSLSGTVIPEPATLALLLSGIGTLLMRRAGRRLR